MAVKVSADNFDTEVLQSQAPVLVDFYSDSCIPCKRMSPILAELEEEYEGRFKLCKVNVNVNLPLSERYSVLSAPTLVLFKGGMEQERRPGFLCKESIGEMIHKILEG